MNTLQRLYRLMAPLYEQNVIPAFGPLATDLADWITRCMTAHLRYELHDPFDLEDTPISAKLKTLSAVDIGTGTGILARELGRSVREVIGIDLSLDMLTQAQRLSDGANLRNLHFMVGDVHQLPLRRNSVDLITSSFGFNATNPKQSLKAVLQALRPGKGVLAFQEWGAEDAVETLLNDTLREFAPDETPDIDDVYQEYFATPKPWYDHLQDTEDYYEMLKRFGFDLVWVKEAPFVTVHFATLDIFLTAKCAWPSRALYIAAMTSQEQDALQTALRARLAPYLNPDGSFDWSPPLFRVFAVR